MDTANRRVVNGINTVVLYGKDYIEVVERLRLLHTAGKEFEVIESQPVQMGDRCLWRVSVLVDGKRYTANAEVKLKNAKPGSPDASNPFECAETSALGRCLAFAGFGTLESIASYDEIARSHPGVTVVEAATMLTTRTASNGTSHNGKTLSASTQSVPGASEGQQVNGKNGHPHSTRLNEVYVRVREAKLASSPAEFLTWVGSLFPDRTVGASQDISLEMLEYLEVQVSQEQEAAHA